MGKIFLKIRSLLKRKIFFKGCLFFSRYSYKQFPFILKLFNFCLYQLGDSIYYESYKKRYLLSGCISKIKLLEIKKEKINNIGNSHEINLAIEKLKTIGIYENLDIKISKDSRNDFVNYINRSNFYDSHVISDKPSKCSDENVTGAYKSYDYNTQLNNPTLLNLCLNPKLLKIAELYLGCMPNIDSINTFITLPKKLSFTHEFHRDLNNIKQLVVFIYWTKTSFDNGSFEYIRHTHKPSNFLQNLLMNEKSIFKDNCESFFQNTTPGYGNCDNYQKIFKSEIVSTFGDECKIVACDPFGLHRGTPVKSPRMVTWIRFGNSISRQKMVSAEETKFKKASLNDECREIFLKSKFRFLLNDFVNY